MSDIVTSRIFIDAEKGITAAKLNDITVSSVIQPSFYTSKPTASTADPTDIALILKSGAYAQVPISTLTGSLSNAAIWSVRLRSFNAIGNPNFEVDQRTVGNGAANPAAGTFLCDRWFKGGGGTYQISGQSIAQGIGGASSNVLPGTNFRLSTRLLSITLNTQQTTMGAGDFLVIRHIVEGNQFREVCQDVHSVSILMQSSVAPLKFGLYLRDGPTVSRSLTKLCTYPGPANTWQLITLSNLPVWSAGNFSILPGNQGYDIGLCFACGSTNMSPANDTWQNTTSVGAVGQDNWCANPVNSTIFLGFVQHEPGPVCSTLIDKPFAQNYDECLRYYQKSFDYDVAVGTAAAAGYVGLMQQSTTVFNCSTRFHKPMAKVPTMIGFNNNTGAANSVRNGGVDYAISSIAAGKNGFGQVTTSAAMPAPGAGFGAYLQYTADTGW